MKTFYRVSNTNTQQGLWYNFDGNFTGLIHNKFNFCTHKDLKMDFDETLVGYLSATDSLDTLYEWFPKEDILKLQKHGYYIHIYETDDFKFYEKFQHLVINQSKSKLITKIIL
jgi:IS1 family transposase